MLVDIVVFHHGSIITNKLRSTSKGTSTSIERKRERECIIPSHPCIVSSHNVLDSGRIIFYNVMLRMKVVLVFLVVCVLYAEYGQEFNS